MATPGNKTKLIQLTVSNEMYHELMAFLDSSLYFENTAQYLRFLITKDLKTRLATSKMAQYKVTSPEDEIDLVLPDEALIALQQEADRTGKSVETLMAELIEATFLKEGVVKKIQKVTQTKKKQN